MRRNGARNFGLFITTIFIKTPPSANFTEKIENKKNNQEKDHKRQKTDKKPHKKSRREEKKREFCTVFLSPHVISVLSVVFV